MIPQTDKHKLAGFFGGLIVSGAAYYGINVPLEVAIIIFNGAWLLISTLVGKQTNPTGANRSEDRQVLEAVVKETQHTGSFAKAGEQ